MSNASFENNPESEVDRQWLDVIDRRSREIEQGLVDCRPVEDVVRDLRHRLQANRET